MTAEVVAVVGAGVMGSDVALDFASHNYRVILKDITDEILENARGNIKRSYSFVKMMKKDFFSSPLEEILSNIMFATGYDHFGEADIVIENITENFEAKKKLYAELRNVCRDDAVFGVNTSCIPITKIGELMPKPQNVIGVHLMNPVPLKPFVEIIRGKHTSEETVEKTKSIFKNLDKTCIVVNDCAGFVSNRILMVTINEAIRLIQDSIAEPQDVDMICKLGFGHKMGPLATADLIGLDTIMASLVVLYENYNDPKYEPCPLLKQMVDDGLLGKKSGKGFFEYRI
ncbi:MAG: 3-hydroxyacyl-CoA dehydrogenase family protein [Planctomycetota bacterium]|jgi:3-hydroxybutyryl-CoA dehydrogenase